MSAPLNYSGPGQVAYGYQGSTYIFQAEGENGAAKLDFQEKRTKRYTAMFGYHKSTVDDQTCKVSLTPFDSWGILPALFPPYLGINTGGATTTGGQQVGVRPHDYAAGTAGAVSANGTSPTTIWTPDGRLYTVARSAITKHPGLKLGVGLPLFTGMEITGLIPVANAMGASSGLVAVTGESGQSNNAGSSSIPAYGVPDFINGHWTGALGSLTGFTALDAEDGWEIMIDVKYSPLTVSKRTLHMKLDSVEIMAKARITGLNTASAPMGTHTEITAQILAHTLGGVLTGTPDDLILTGPSSKTITLKDCECYMEGSGFEFGGTKLGTGEVAFVTELDFTSGATKPVLIFSV